MDWQKHSENHKSKKEKITAEKNRITGDASKLKYEMDAEERRLDLIRSTGMKEVIDKFEKEKAEFDAKAKSQREKLEKEWDDILDIEDELDKKFNSRLNDPEYKKFEKERDLQYKEDLKRKEAIVQAEGDKYYQDLMDKQSEVRINETYFYRKEEEIYLFHILDKTIEKKRYGFGSRQGWEDSSLNGIHTVHEVNVNLYSVLILESNINKWLLREMSLSFDDIQGKSLYKAISSSDIEENEKIGHGAKYSQSFIKILFEDSIKFY